eukprot:5988301-Prymnesium_polylepis.2
MACRAKYGRWPLHRHHEERCAPGPRRASAPGARRVLLSLWGPLSRLLRECARASPDPYTSRLP